MILAFYRVDNSKEYERHTFDYIADEPKKILEMLSKLDDEELRIYDMDDKYDVYDFEVDYNDEILDGGWWCVVIMDNKNNTNN